MSDTETTRGGFIGDPAEALTVTGTSGCCGNPPRSSLTLPDPCCGTEAEAAADNTCCGSAAKDTAVASGQGCCG
jgi:hypothetical protein